MTAWSNDPLIEHLADDIRYDVGPVDASYVVSLVLNAAVLRGWRIVPAINMDEGLIMGEWTPDG